METGHLPRDVQRYLQLNMLKSNTSPTYLPCLPLPWVTSLSQWIEAIDTPLRSPRKESGTVSALSPVSNQRPTPDSTAEPLHTNSLLHQASECDRGTSPFSLTSESHSFMCHWGRQSSFAMFYTKASSSVLWGTWFRHMCNKSFSFLSQTAGIPCRMQWPPCLPTHIFTFSWSVTCNLDLLS